MSTPHLPRSFLLACLFLRASLLAFSQGSVTDYAPITNISCPNVSSDPLIRTFTPQNQTLHPAEEAYIGTRESSVLPGAWSDWIGNGSDIGYNMSDFQGSLPKIGIAISGGGYRAALYGAGVLSGFDARVEAAKKAGTGGLLQVSSYLSALSGGSWLTGSVYFNNFPNITDMVYGNDELSGWILDLDLATPDGFDLFNDENQHFYGSIVWSVMAKAALAIDTSITDPWARMISYHFLNETSRDNFFTNDSAHGAGQIWSQMPDIPAFAQHQVPLPIIMADSRPIGDNSTGPLPPGPTVYEITPFEFGSWDPGLSAMMNLSFTGTHLLNGQPDNDTACVQRFDQAGFVMGTSASLFNQILDVATNTLNGFGEDGAGLLYVLSRQLQEVRTRADDVANWPNPFNGINPDTFEDSGSRWLELVDGSTNGENVPLGQLFVKARGLDVIVGVDASANDANNWPNGSSIIASQNRINTILNTSHQGFPPIPSTEEDFISTGVRQRPTFFGCNPTQTPPEYPILIYMPNSPPLTGDNPVTNTGTFKLSYTALHTQLFLEQTQQNTIGGFLADSNIPDPDFGKCVQCAAIDRARFRLSPAPARSDYCAQCFTHYCFDPSDPPSSDELPGRKLVFVDPQPTGFSKIEDLFKDHKAAWIGGGVALIFVLIGLIGFLIWWRKRKTYVENKRMSKILDDAVARRHLLDPSATDYESYEDYLKDTLSKEG
ncbi:phospholipase B [Obba rivulosa]|uniref:Lysophospholipase n=1 Tax=Obba rivulosa TaxID=1052685 RepID=A0A8E2DQA4_9APHY|nr:phospholipase B [Obba rivulosa]